MIIYMWLNSSYKTNEWSVNDFSRSRLTFHRLRILVFLEPKSKSGTRTITLGKKALDILRDHKREQEKLIYSVGQDWTDLDLVIPSGVGTPLTASNIRRDFRQLLAASGLPKIRFHDLRHTAASLMLNHGIPVLIVSKRLGHSKPSITLDVYGHLIPSKQEEAAQLMDDLMFEGWNRQKKDPRFRLSWVFTGKTSVYRLLAEDLNLEPSG